MSADADKTRADNTSVKTVEEFVRWTQARDGRSLLYRGLAGTGAGWLVESAAYRRIKESDGTPDLHHVFKNYIVQLLETATRRGLRAHAGGEFSDLELLAQLQHFGAATCLIDFTYNPLAALWFACREESKQDGKVVVMDTARSDAVAMNLSKSAKPQEVFRRVEGQQHKDPIEKFLDGKTLWRWEPLPRKNRVIAQQSIFVFGKTMIEDRYYEEVRVPSSAKAEITSALREKFGVTEENLFGDFAGFALANAHDKPYTEYSADDYYELAKSSSQSNDEKKAMHYCDKAIAANSQHVEAHSLRGECNRYLKNWREAIEDFSQAIEIDFKHIPSFLFRGVSNEIGLQKFDKAIDDYSRVIELISSDNRKAVKRLLAVVYQRRGCAKAKKEKHPDAIADFTSAIALDPENAEMYLDRAKSHRALGNESEAQADEKKADELDPTLRKSNPAQDPPQ